MNVPCQPHLPHLPVFLPLALGPHPQRELTLTPSRGFACPRLRVAAGAISGPETSPAYSKGLMCQSEESIKAW